MKSAERWLDPNLLDFQRRTIAYVHQRMFKEGQKRFLVADEVGLGKTKVAQGVIALSTKGRARNVVYVASSSHIVGQNLRKLTTGAVEAGRRESLAQLAIRAHSGGISGELIGFTPIKDLRADHFGSVSERALLYDLLARRHRALMAQPEVRELFQGRVDEKKFSGYLGTALPRSLRENFDRHLPLDVIDDLRDADKCRSKRREIIGKLRAVLARCTLDTLNPVLVVVDEIQRFSSDLMAQNPTPQVAWLLGRPVLVLSATPYQADAPRAENGKHKGFIDLVKFLNPRRPAVVGAVEMALEEMAQSLQQTRIDRERVAAAAAALEECLSRFMTRTERPPEAIVARRVVDAVLSDTDLKALRQAMSLLKAASPSSKDRRHRFAEFVELWKSTPHLLSAISDRYVAGRDIHKLLETKPRRLASPAALTVAQLQRRNPMRGEDHPRLRALITAMGRDAEDRRLWLPPTVPYVNSAATDRQASKTLVFTSWSAAPAAIATALNLIAELRPHGKKKDLELSRTSPRGEDVTVKSVYVLAAPLWRFAFRSDPFAAMRSAGGPLDETRMLAAIRSQLKEADVLTISRSAKGNAVDPAVALNRTLRYPDAPKAKRSHLSAVKSLMEETNFERRSSVRLSVANEIALMAAAAPGTCAFRALRRAIPGLGCKQARGAWLAASLEIGAAIVRVFQRPAAAAIVEASIRGKLNYWQKVLRFCLAHDLQSVLDEYLFLLARDSSETDPAKLAMALAHTVDVGLKTVGGVHVVRPRAPVKPVKKDEKPPKRVSASYGPAMFARSLGEHDREAEDDTKPGARSRLATHHASPLLTAFNSPFPPFVLATTSTGQEGLDLHRYCRRLAHWNLPASPLALEQREGRIDRYLGLGVRTSIAQLGLPASAANARPRLGRESVWGLLLQAARDSESNHRSVLAPYWHFGSARPIEALALNIPFSREEMAWERLLEEASWYRLVLGQSEPTRLLQRLANGSEENRLQISGIRLNLAPKI